MAQSKLPEKPEVDICQFSQPWEHSIQVGAELKVPTEPLDKHPLHDPKREAMMFLRKNEFVNMFLSFDFLIFELPESFLRYGGRPTFRFIIAKPQQWIRVQVSDTCGNIIQKLGRERVFQISINSKINGCIFSFSGFYRDSP